MYCSNCGYPLEDGVKFCPQCGTPVEGPAENKIGSEYADDTKISSAEAEAPKKAPEPEPVKLSTSEKLDALSEESFTEDELAGDLEQPEKQKIDWKQFLTMENLERFAPAAAILPLAMFLVVSILGKVLYAAVMLVPFSRILVKVLLGLIKAIFLLTTLGATAGLGYLVYTKKDKSKVMSWITPAGTFLAFLSCVGITSGWGFWSFLLGLAAVALGLEFIPRIVLGGDVIDNNPDFAGAIGAYKMYYDAYKEKYPSTKDEPEEDAMDDSDDDREPSYFDGGGAELLGYTILTVFVSAITCGLAAPWMICKLYKWRMNHTVINGKRLDFSGTGASLLGNWIVWTLLSIITCGIYSFFAYVALKKWELKNTFIDDEPIFNDGIDSYFDGGSVEYLGYGILAGLLMCVTCGIAYPWVLCMLQKWETKHSVINHRRLEFKGTGLGFFGEFIVIALLSLITCGIYAPWGTVRLNKYIVKNTDFIE